MQLADSLSETDLHGPRLAHASDKVNNSFQVVGVHRVLHFLQREMKDVCLHVNAFQIIEPLRK